MAGDLDLDVDFAGLYQSQVDGLVRLAFLVCGNSAVAEDAVSSAVARVLVRWRAGRVHDPAAYLRRAVINEVTGGFRRRRGERRALDRRDAARPEETAQEDQIADRDLLWRALDQLPLSQRVVIVLRLYEDLGETETAAVLGINVGTVKSRLARALQRLRVLIGEECLDA
jgi:RNA polymerase sigma-70 factor (sigma-E family)